MRKYKIILGEIAGYLEYKIPSNRSALYRVYGRYIDDMCSMYFSSLFYNICINSDDIVTHHLLESINEKH